MLDRERILARLDELEGYARELRGIVPQRENKSPSRPWDAAVGKKVDQ